MYRGFVAVYYDGFTAFGPANPHVNSQTSALHVETGHGGNADESLFNVTLDINTFMFAEDRRRLHR